MAEVNIPVRVKHQLELGENAFWAFIWTMVGIVLLALVSILTSHSIESDRLIAQSADPVATACATGLGSTVTNQCTVLLARK